jgi:hypothetical protein
VVPDLDLVVVVVVVVVVMTSSEPSTAEDVRAGGDSQRMVGNVVVPSR